MRLARIVIIGAAVTKGMLTMFAFNIASPSFPDSPACISTMVCEVATTSSVCPALKGLDELVNPKELAADSHAFYIPPADERALAELLDTRERKVGGQ